MYDMIKMTAFCQKFQGIKCEWLSLLELNSYWNTQLSKIGSWADIMDIDKVIDMLIEEQPSVDKLPKR